MKSNFESNGPIVLAPAIAVLMSATLAGCSGSRVAAAPADAAEPVTVAAAPVVMTDVADAIDAGDLAKIEVRQVEQLAQVCSSSPAVMP